MSFDAVYGRDGTYYGKQPSAGLVALLGMERPVPGLALDLGCGEGRDALWLASHGFDVTAVDISEVGIATLRTAGNPRIKCVVADVRHYSIPSESYALISAATILDHIDLNEAATVARRLVDGLVPGGLLFAEVFSTDDPGFTGIGASSETSIYVKHYFRAGQLMQIFSGLEKLHYEEIVKIDRSHGPIHNHGVAVLLARKSIPAS